MKSSLIPRRHASLGLAVLVGIAVTIALAAPARAQSVSDPRIAEFDPSPDHWQVLDSGTPAVVRYELGVYTLGASAPFATADMGKPSPDYDGKIRFDFFAQLAAWQLPGGEYEARVSAVGPEGAALSDASNPFTFTTDDTPCTFSVNATKISAPASGGTYGVDVVTGIGCEWAVANEPLWVTLWTGGGSGSGTLAFEVEPNPTATSRAGTIEVAGQILTVSQAAGVEECSYSVTPTVFSFSAASDSGKVSVTTGSGCGWSAASSESWLAPEVTGGSGGATFSFTVKQNNAITNRQATLTVGPWAVTVFQSGKARRTK
ncbi:MAG: BACON domain-containing protein [Vicinamibacterales bacterium]